MTRDELLASLLQTSEAGSYYPPAGDDGDHRYFDWSTRAEDGAYHFEAGDGTDTILMNLTRDELRGLHAALTLTLLQDVEG